jgi:hypothetical protein
LGVTKTRGRFAPRVLAPRAKITPRCALRDFVPKAVSTKSFGRPRAFRVEKARSAPIAVGFADAQ